MQYTRTILNSKYLETCLQNCPRLPKVNKQTIP